jgi:hypothetical protein
MGASGRAAYRIFVLLLGLWTGSGVHDSLSSHFARHADPVAYADRPTLPGTFSPWPFSALLLLIAIGGAALILAALGRIGGGSGRRA